MKDWQKKISTWTYLETEVEVCKVWTLPPRPWISWLLGTFSASRCFRHPRPSCENILVHVEKIFSRYKAHLLLPRGHPRSTTLARGPTGVGLVSAPAASWSWSHLARLRRSSTELSTPAIASDTMSFTAPVITSWHARSRSSALLLARLAGICSQQTISSSQNNLSFSTMTNLNGDVWPQRTS